MTSQTADDTPSSKGMLQLLPLALPEATAAAGAIPGAARLAFAALATSLAWGPLTAGESRGALAVSMQVLPSCSVRVEGQFATVDCPAGLAYATSLSPPSAQPSPVGPVSATLPDTTKSSAEPGTLTIRY